MPASVFRWEETKGGRSGLLKSCLLETPVYELDCGGFAPNFFPFLFKKQFSSNLVQTFKSSVDVVERAFTLLHVGKLSSQGERAHPAGMLAYKSRSRTRGLCTCNRCVRVRTYVCTCLSPQVYFALQCQCSELPEAGRKNLFFSMTLLKTPCAASELFLVQ